MSVVQHILNEELERLEGLARKYQRDINNLPKGSLSKKRRNGKTYIYRAYRENDKVKFDYIGRESSEAVREAVQQREQRQKYIGDLRRIKKDIKEIKRTLYGRRR